MQWDIPAPHGKGALRDQSGSEMLLGGFNTPNLRRPAHDKFGTLTRFFTMFPARPEAGSHTPAEPGAWRGK